MYYYYYNHYDYNNRNNSVQNWKWNEPTHYHPFLIFYTKKILNTIYSHSIGVLIIVIVVGLYIRKKNKCYYNWWCCLLFFPRNTSKSIHIDAFRCVCVWMSTLMVISFFRSPHTHTTLIAFSRHLSHHQWLLLFWIIVDHASHTLTLWLFFLFLYIKWYGQIGLIQKLNVYIYDVVVFSFFLFDDVKTINYDESYHRH